MVSVPPKLPSKPSGQTSATLSDGKVTYNFLLDPQTLSWSSQADYSSNSVLLTDKPDVTWKSSVSALSVPNVLFISQGMTQDVSEAIKQLTDWCSSGTTLKFAFGSTVIPRCHIARFTHTEKQWRSGKCTQAEGNLDFLISREPQAVITASVVDSAASAAKFPTTTPQAVKGQANIPSSTTATTRELDRDLGKVKELLKNPNNRRKVLSIRPGLQLLDPNRTWQVSLRDIDGEVRFMISDGGSSVSYYRFSELKQVGLL